MQTKNLANEKFEILKELFPNAITESINDDGELVRAVDKDALELEISTNVVGGGIERYQFTWPEKRKAILNANAPISKTLRPCREESLNFDETENLYIEGDNLEVLKLLQETYLGKVKMIYIDPPYNTGSDFVYNDDFKESTEEYLENSGQFDEEGNRLEKNLESNGRFHTDWLNMIYPRLKLARNLLSDDGVIFISIDDNEQENLKKVCDEVFGESNFVASFIWQKTFSPKNNNKFVSEDHDFIICYTKNKMILKELNKLQRKDENNKAYKFNDNDGKGLYTLSDLTIGEKKGYDIHWNGKIYKEPPTRGWAFNEKRMYELIKEGRVYLPEEENKRPRYKRYLSEVPGIISKTILPYDLVGHTQSSKQALDNLIGINIFDYPKPIELVKYFELIASNKDSLILDFFSGSATTAHAVMQLNAEDGGSRKFIMVQLPEETDEKSEAYKAGYKNICEIGKERIRRAGKKILEDNKDKEGIENLDIGFRVLKTDTSNMKDVYYKPGELNQNFLDTLTDNIKEDRKGEDLLFQVMLDLGIPLSSKIETEDIDGKEIFIVDDGYLIASFDRDIDDSIVTKIAKREPAFAVFRDSSMKSDSALNNFDQIFERLSPETTRRVI